MDQLWLAISVVGVLLTLGLVLLIILIVRMPARAASAQAEASIEKLLAAQQQVFGRVDAMGGQLAEVAGRVSQATDGQEAKHGELARSLNARLDSLGQRVSVSLTEQAEKNASAIGGLTARLKAIDEAQKNLVDLSTQVVSLQDILSNKQARGAFGQGQMETIVADSLPAGSYEFQAQLSNGTRPDCLIHLPRAAAGIVIDAKFPRESFVALSSIDGADALKAAQTRVRAEMRRHVDDIAAKYLIPGETQDPAIMFLPAESIFCTVSADFFDVIQHAQRKRVAIVSPNMLMLAVNTMRALLRDQKMREQAHRIQEEVLKLMEDVARLGDRAGHLKQHFSLAEKDLREIETSAGKIISRGERIASVELECDVGFDEGIPAPRPALLAGE